MAPEILSKKPYDFKVDVWSATVLLYILLSGDMPFYGDTLEDMRVVVKNSDIEKQVLLSPKWYKVSS